MHSTEEVVAANIKTNPLPSPRELQRELPLGARASITVAGARARIESVLAGRDDRLIAIVGPCSIHDPSAALAYAMQLEALAEQHADELVICMRMYFEKARTHVGWKGLINDPALDGSCDVAEGLRIARRLLCALAELGLPAATETLDPAIPPYLSDLIAWTAIGARTTESPTHRELASGLPMPVGLKNGTDGGLEVALNALKTARAPHSFLGIDASGQMSVVRTRGNPNAHVVLRGGSSGPNFGAREVQAASAALRDAGLNPRVIVDCSHGNSQKNHENQPRVARSVAEQVARGDSTVVGVMLESQLVAGRQVVQPGAPLVYGQSITDACIDMETTAAVLRDLAASVREKRAAYQARA